MLLLSLNIRHGGADRIDAIVEYIGSQAADAIVLTEFRNGESGDALRTRLRSFGYIYEFCPTTLVGVNSVLVASRTTAAAIDLAPPESEIHRIIGCKIGELAICGVYFSQNRRKIPLFEFILGSTQLRWGTIICGDLNTGLHGVDEVGATFFCVDQFSALAATGMVDLWRRHNGPDAREYSWISPKGNGFRIDHCFGSTDVVPRVLFCRYDHATRPKLTDHSAMILALS